MSLYLTLWKWCFVAISHISFVLTAFRSFQYPSVTNHTTPPRMFEPMPRNITWNETKRTTQHEVGTEWAHGCGIPWLHHILRNTVAERAMKQPPEQKTKNLGGKTLWGWNPILDTLHRLSHKTFIWHFIPSKKHTNFWKPSGYDQGPLCSQCNFRFFRLRCPRP